MDKMFIFIALFPFSARAWGLTEFIENAISLPQGILIVIIIGIAMFIAIVILTVGLFTLKR